MARQPNGPAAFRRWEAVTVILIALPLVVAVALLVRGVSANARRLHAAATALRWVHVSPTAAHAPLAPYLQAYLSAGCALEGYAMLDLGSGSSIPAAVLVHPDGTVVDVAVLPDAVGSHVSTSATSLLADGLTVLETRSRQGSLAGPHQLVEVVPDGRPWSILEQHRATRAWLAAQGIGHRPVRLGEGARLAEHGARLFGAERPPSPWTVLRLALDQHRPNRGPIPSQPDAAAKVWALRARLDGPGSTG